MGGKSKSVTVGYKHFLGMHCVFCLGPIDRFIRISSDNRDAWTGQATGGTINVSADELYGGESREGGFSGDVDVLMGGPAQTKNAYLLSKIGANIPAYRGVASMVFKEFYFGNNPYLKPISARGQRVYVGENGEDQWYQEIAGISGAETTKTSKPFTIAWWQSSFHTGNNDHARMGMRFYDEDGNLIGSSFAPMIGTTRLVWTQRTWSGTQPAGTAYAHLVMEMQRIEGSNNDGYIDDITLEVGGLNIPVSNPGAESSTNGWTSTVGGLDTANSTPAPHTGGFFFTGGNSANTSAYQQIGVGGLDMNPAHMIRECLTNRDWGMGYAEDDIDDDTFEASAETLYAEGLGMSLVWDKQTKIEDFVNECVRHIDAALFVSRTTGKFKLKLIRADYDPDTLIVLDESNIEKITEPTKAAFGELVNSVTVQFWRSLTGKDDSVTLQDPAGVQQQGTVINTTLQYPGFTNLRTAAIVCGRDLRALSNPFLSCTVFTGDIARDLEPGDVFKLTWGKWKLNQIIMRVTGFAILEGKSEQVRLTVVEDVFATPLNAVVAPPGEEWENPSQPPDPVEHQIAMEAPYYELIQINGQTQTETDLTTNPNLGYVLAAAVRPGNAINAKLWTDAGAGYEESDVMDFAPSAILTAAMTKTATIAYVEDMQDLDLVPIGSHCQIGSGEASELCRVDGIDQTLGQITLGRGVLDTVVHEHPIGSAIMFWDLFAGGDPTEYASGEIVDVKITPVSGAGQVALIDAIESTVTLDQRAYRPYPPGDLTINGGSYVNTSYTGTLTVEWAHRDRLQQTSGELADHFDGDIGPEAGTTYRVRTYLDDVLDDEQDEVAGTSASVTPSFEGLVRIEVNSKRDGVYSMQAAAHQFLYIGGGSPRALEDEGSDVYRYGEDSGMRLTED